MVFVVKRARRGLLRRNQWSVSLVASNGRVLMHSEGYNNRFDAIQTIELIRANAHDATIDAH